MGSSRLPGKVLKDLNGKPMLEWVVKRSSFARKVDDVLVATTTDSGDDAIEKWCRSSRIACFRGSVFDVLDRYYQAAKENKADRIVRVTADCPLMDPELIDEMIGFYENTQADFAANRLPPPWHRTFPIGLDIEVVSFALLEKAWKEAVEPFEREHVMPWFYDKEGRFKVKILDHDPDYGQHRWTVDTPEDYQFLQKLFAKLSDPLHASWLDVLKIVSEYPELERINADSQAKRVDNVDERAENKL